MTPREQSGTGAPARRDHRQEVTDSIIKMLEDGVAPWQKPWESAGMPFNPTTDKGYRGGNAVHLMATGLSRGYEDPRWMTYKQAAENGWQVRKGEKGTHIEFWEVKAKREEKSAEPVRGGQDETAKENQSRFIHRVYTVFNAKQVEGVPALVREQPSAFEAVHSAERILANSGAKIAHDQRDSAFYSRSSDSIHLPLKETFKDAPGYYGTALHELAHWTGHANQQRHIRWEIRGLPRHITETKQRLADIEGDIGLRDGTDAAEFSMAVGNHVFSGKGAREEAAKALTFAVMTWRDDQTIQPRGKFRGFEILSKGKSGGFGLLQEDDRVPELFVRGRATYSANLNPANPVGTVQSIEYTLRSLDKLAAEQQGRVARAEKELVDYEAQADRPFEHEDRLKLLLVRQSELNSQLDLDKGDQQAADSAPEINEDLERDKIAAAAVPSPSEVAKMAEAYMRAAGTAIREMPILQRTPPETGSVTGRAVAKDEAHVAVATAANRFIVVEATTLSRDIQIGERLSLLFSKGRASLDNDRGLER